MHIMRRTLAALLSCVLAILPIGPAQAAMVGTGEIVSPALQQRPDESRLRQLLAQESAREQLRAWGVDPAQLDARISSLSNSELARINAGIESQQAGGDVLGVLVLIFVIFIITDVIGATDIFPFIHPVR